MTEPTEPTEPVGPTEPTGPPGGSQRSGEGPGRDGPVHWLGDYVYGTISTLVAIAGLTFETNPGELTTAGVVVVGAVAIWLAHALSRLVILDSWQRLGLKTGDVIDDLRSSWSILAAALPATVIFALAGLHVWSVKAAFTIAEAVGVLGLAVVGVGTTGGSDQPWARRLLYVVGLVGVGVVIVLFELLIHLL